MSAPFDLPAPIAAVTGDGHWQPLVPTREGLGWIVERGRAVPLWVRVEQPGAPVGLGSVAAEADRLTWAASALTDTGIGVPEVVATSSGAEGTPAFLVTTLPYGETDLRLLPGADDPLRILAETLRTFHELDASACPFSVSVGDCVGHVADRVDAGLVHVDDLHDVYRRSTPTSLLGHLETMAPEGVSTTDQVLVHGRITVGTLRVDPARAALTGVLGWDWTGVGDRHLDLAVTARSVMDAFGGDAVGGFFSRYGHDDLDPMRLEFYGLVEELR